MIMNLIVGFLSGMMFLFAVAGVVGRKRKPTIRSETVRFYGPGFGPIPTAIEARLGDLVQPGGPDVVTPSALPFSDAQRSELRKFVRETISEALEEWSLDTSDRSGPGRSG